MKVGLFPQHAVAALPRERRGVAVKGGLQRLRGPVQRLQRGSSGLAPGGGVVGVGGVRLRPAEPPLHLRRR